MPPTRVIMMRFYFLFTVCLKYSIEMTLSFESKGASLTFVEDEIEGVRLCCCKVGT